MTALQPDEKACPFCAEIIKAAAVKCRYCHSDLPEPESAATAPEPVRAPETPELVEPVDLVEPVEPVEPASAGEAVPSVLEKVPAAPPAPPATESTTSSGKGVLVALLVASLLLAGGSVVLLLTWPSAADRPDGLEVGKGNQVVTQDFRDEALAAAAANTVTVLSYSYKTLEQDEEKARSVMTADFVEEYEDVMKQAEPKARSARLTLKANIAASSLVSLEPRRAVALLFVNTATTSEKSEGQQVDQRRVLVTMTRRDGDWIVSKIDAF